MEKIVNLEKLRKILSRNTSKKVVFFSGAFDLFHYAHLKALRRASALGDIFVVQVDGNNLVKKRKGNDRPYLDESERANIISSLEFVDYVFVSNLPSEDIRILKSVDPNVLVRAILPNQTDIKRAQREKKLLEKIPYGKVVWFKQSPEISTTKIISTVQDLRPGISHQNTSVTIGIAAYNAESNIRQLLNSLLKQKGAEQVNEIIVHSDAGSDDTVKIVKQLKSPLIKIIDSKVRKGFAGSVDSILKVTKTEIVVLLNDDIKITDNYFIEKLLKPFEQETMVGLVSGNPQPLSPKNFVEKAAVSSVKAYEAMRNNFKDGHNEFTCDGKILALSKNFFKNLYFPKNYNEVGNVDAFLYFSCIANGFKYRHAKNAKVLYRCPSNLKDYLSLTARNNSQFYLLKNQFGEIVKKEFQLPKSIYKYYFKEFIKNPLGCMFIFTTGIYLKIKARSFEKWLTSTWDVVGSTKKLTQAEHG